MKRKDKIVRGERNGREREGKEEKLNRQEKGRKNI